MKTIAGYIVAVLIFSILLVATDAIYVVTEAQQVVITQFGSPVGKPIIDAGLHFKLPFIQKKHKFDKRLLEWDGDPNQIPTRDKKYIWIDSTARWRIADALKFYQSVGNEIGAHARLDDIVNSATRDIITNHLLVEAVRNSNRILAIDESEGDDVIVTEEAVERIGDGRDELEKLILKKAKELIPQYGIALVDVRIKRINYVEAVRRKVYERMISERKRAAQRYHSEGEGRKAEIVGQVEKELKQITSEAYRKAQGIKGSADAQAITIYADAYSKDAEFYSFFKTLETYERTIDAETTLILTTDSKYYNLLKDIRAQ